MVTATLAVLLGLFGLVSNAESYSDSFSTIFRVSRTAELSAEVEEKDGTGRDPLPAYLEHARLELHAKSNKSTDSSAEEVMPDESAVPRAAEAEVLLEVAPREVLAASLREYDENDNSRQRP
jgi:hypothetical protein